MMQYVAVRQCSNQDVLRIDLQRADSLPCPSVFRLDSKLCDETVNAVWKEPGNFNEGVVLMDSRQIGHQARGCRICTQMQVITLLLQFYVESRDQIAGACACARLLT